MTRQEFRFHSRYAFYGLFVCVCCIALAAWLLVLGVGPQAYQIKVMGFEVNASAPGLAIAVLGVAVIWLTKFPRSSATITPHGRERDGGA